MRSENENTAFQCLRIWQGSGSKVLFRCARLRVELGGSSVGLGPNDEELLDWNESATGIVVGGGARITLSAFELSVAGLPETPVDSDDAILSSSTVVTLSLEGKTYCSLSPMFG
jgi:hypothetical protein